MNPFSKKAILSLIVLTLLSIFVFARQTADTIKKLPSTQWTRVREIDVKHLAIDLRFDWKKRQAYGITAIRLAPFNSTGQISLDAGMLTINSILLNEMPLKFKYDGGDKNGGLVITLDRVYKAGEELTLTIDYHTNWINETDPVNLNGSNGKGLRFIWPTPAEPTRKKQIWSVGDPESNRYWFPCYDYPNDLRTTEFKATVEKNLTVISNGLLVGTKDNADGTRTFQYQSDVPYANQVTTFVIGEFVDVPQHYEDIQLHNFSYTDEIEATTASVERLPDMVRFFSEFTAIKYPYPSYSQVFVQDLPWGIAGMGIATQSENMVDDYGTHADYLYLWDGLEGESLARQWFGNYVTASDWSHTWLSKGLSRYFSGLYNIHKNGIDEFLFWQHGYDQLVYSNDWSSGFREPLVHKQYEDVISFTGGNHPYFHGASVMRSLHKQLGDEKWQKSIRTYLKMNANKLATTEDFRKAIEEATGESMDWFFEQWVYRTGHPVFEITKEYDAIKNELKLTVRQTQKIDSTRMHPQVEFFQGKIEVEIDNRIQQVWLEPKTTNVFIIAASEEPRLVNFDYQSSWTKELTFEKSFDELLYQLQYSKDILARQWAINELSIRTKNETLTTDDQSKFADVLRTVIQSHAYWRIRAAALSQLRALCVTRGQSAKLDDITTTMLLNVIRKDRAWVKATAIGFLGLTNDPGYADLYIQAFADSSDRVINAAAIALGRSKSPKAYPALAKLVSRPSWKNQSLMSALSGLQQLGDLRGYDIAYKALADLYQPRWNLPQPGVWDYRIFAAQTIASLGRSSSAYPLILERLKKSLKENDLNVIFNNVLLIETLADPRGQEIFGLLKTRFKNNEDLMDVVDQYEAQFKQVIDNQAASGSR